VTIAARSSNATDGRDSAIVIHPDFRDPDKGRRDPAARLAETVALAGAIFLDVVHAEVVTVKRPRPNTLIGGGAVERIGDTVRAAGCGLVIVDTRLSPVQQRNLEKAWDAKVIDRTALILEIFGERARTREGALQVELAHLTYQRSRLVRSWTHLERQRGGLGFVGGPGETQIELDRRLIDERITKIKRELATVTRTRGLHRRARRRVPYSVIALVGYTNAGKSTLFNHLTAASVMAEDMLFATLDPTMRRLALPSGRDAMLSDTVGFISDLPTDLVAAFRATLEEVIEADLIVHVRDISHPDTEAQKDDVERVLNDLGLGQRLESDMIEVFNKIDLLGESGRKAVIERAQASNRPTVAASALTGDGCDDLLRLIDQVVARGGAVIEVAIEPWDGATLAWLYGHGEVLSREDDEQKIKLKVRMTETEMALFKARGGGSEAPAIS